MGVESSRTQMDRKETTKMSKCLACPLGVKAPGTQNCVKGWGNPSARLVIVLDSPGDHLAEKCLIWILDKLSLGGNDVFIDYTFKCPVKKEHKKKDLLDYYKICWGIHERKEIINNVSLVVAGGFGSSFIGKKNMTAWNGRQDENGIWYVYSFAYLLKNPAECVRTWRVLFKAAEEAGLFPEYNHNAKEFKFPSKKV